MARFVAAWALVVALAPGVAAGRVVLVGVDGASWRVIDGLVAEGALPTFAALAERGVEAELETVEPVVSPVVWTSLATGRTPENHGVSGFLASRLGMTAPTVFDRLAGAGLRVGLFEYLVSWPPPSFPGGFVAPGWMRRDATVWPQDLFERAGVAPWRFDHPRPAFSRAENVAGIRQELVRKPEAFRALLRTFEPDVAATIFYGVDRASHRFWRDAYPEDFNGDSKPGPPRPGSFVREVMSGVDRGLAAIVSDLGPDDVVLVASDHGFQADPDRDDAIWVGRTADRLAAADLVPKRDSFTLIREWGVVLVRVHPGPFSEREPVTEKLRRFYESMKTAEGERLLNVRVLDAAPRPEGAERPWTNRLFQTGLRWFARTFFGARFEEPAHAWVIARFHDELMQRLGPDARVKVGGSTIRAGDLAFAERFDGTHHETAVFLAAGGPLRAVAGRQQLSVLDVAPLITYLAGQPLADDLEGRLPEAWLQPEYLAAHPVRRVPAAEAPRFVADEEGPVPTVDDATMVERLRALGYVR
ncbi:MAG: alkaline phosphatase family protein [Deltaproteobacteria bacterium]|nr:alkaline phosphatase family protein [Deltaproteobacteria bacterium]MBW2446593.1 alkaline phosphatase family protein [Deltaproteobacteria bacterium]